MSRGAATEATPIIIRRRTRSSSSSIITIIVTIISSRKQNRQNHVVFFVHQRASFLSLMQGRKTSSKQVHDPPRDKNKHAAKSTPAPALVFAEKKNCISCSSCGSPCVFSN
jgi:hypothetical protein